VGALGHAFEEAGIATAQISLVREHTARIRPPRALYVPYEFGRPFGRPGDSALQLRILRALLSLFERAAGPVLEDFVDTAPLVMGEGEPPWSCPIAGAPRAAGAHDLERAFQVELSALRPEYERAVSLRGRTSFGLSGLGLDEVVGLLLRLLGGEPPESPFADVAPATLLTRAALDLRAVYTEAASAKPAAGVATSAALEDWFWNETRAAELLQALRAHLAKGPDRELAFAASKMLVPVGRGAPRTSDPTGPLSPSGSASTG